MAGFRAHGWIQSSWLDSELVAGGRATSVCKSWQAGCPVRARQGFNLLKARVMPRVTITGEIVRPVNPSALNGIIYPFPSVDRSATRSNCQRDAPFPSVDRLATRSNCQGDAPFPSVDRLAFQFQPLPLRHLRDTSSGGAYPIIAICVTQAHVVPFA